jgi:hypothetical protein
MRNRIYLQANERGFYHFVMVSGAHDHEKTVVWVNRNLVQRQEGGKAFIPNPIRGATVVATEKGALVMRPTDPAATVFIVEEESGYRGSCDIDVGGPGVQVMAIGKAYHSPRGNLGETAWALVNGFDEIRVKGRRDGRRVDREEIEYTLKNDGKKIEAVEEGLEELL